MFRRYLLTPCYAPPDGAGGGAGSAAGAGGTADAASAGSGTDAGTDGDPDPAATDGADGDAGDGDDPIDDPELEAELREREELLAALPPAERDKRVRTWNRRDARKLARVNPIAEVLRDPTTGKFLPREEVERMRRDALDMRELNQFFTENPRRVRPDVVGSGVQGRLHEHPRIINSLNDENQMQNFMTTDLSSDGWQGRQKIVPVKVGRNWSIGSIPSKGPLPQAGRSSWQDFKIPMKNVYGRVGFEEWVILQSRNGKGAWANVVDQEMEGMVEDMAFRRNVMAWLAGQGILALVNGTHTATTTLTVKGPGNVTGTTMPNRYLQGDTNSGMFIAILDSSTQAIKATATITACNASGATSRRHRDHRGRRRLRRDGADRRGPQLQLGARGHARRHRRRHLRVDVSQHQPDDLSDHEVLCRHRHRTALARRAAAAARRAEHSGRQGRRLPRVRARRAPRLPGAPRARSPLHRRGPLEPGWRHVGREEAHEEDHHLRRHPVHGRPGRALRNALRHQQGIVGPLRRARGRVGRERRPRTEVGPGLRRVDRLLSDLRELPLPPSEAELPDGRHHRQSDRGSLF
jgi:hypothetical protein